LFQQLPSLSGPFNLLSNISSRASPFPSCSHSNRCCYWYLFARGRALSPYYLSPLGPRQPPRPCLSAFRARRSPSRPNPRLGSALRGTVPPRGKKGWRRISKEAANSDRLCFTRSGTARSGRETCSSTPRRLPAPARTALCQSGGSRATLSRFRQEDLPARPSHDNAS
jgi:hypothetical protein